MTLAGIEPAIPASERPQTESLGRAVNEVGVIIPISDIISNFIVVPCILIKSKIFLPKNAPFINHTKY